MLKFNKNAFSRFIFVLVFVVIFTTKAYAVLEFSIIPINGGNDIRFSRGDLISGITKEVRVRITSTDNQQYQVFQELVSPFINERGVTIDRPVLSASILPGSNGSGTAYLSSSQPVNRGQQLLYTSSSSARSEFFTLIYSVDQKYLSDAGTFTGLIQFSVRTVTGNERQTVQTNVFIESNSQITYDVHGSSSQNLVRIENKENALPSYVNLSFSGNSGSNIAVYAQILTYPINDLNFELVSGILKLSLEGSLDGALSFQDTVDIPRNRVLIYKSTQQSDSFSARFTLSPDNLAKVLAGSYRGVIRFSFETDRGVNNFDINLDINILPLFEIALDFPQGPISFKGLIPGSDPQIKEVVVQVRSNLHRPYIVNQKVSDLLVNVKGQEISEKYFMSRQVLNVDYFGTPAAEEFVSVKKGESAIFYSDNKGSSATFKVFYRLSAFPGMNPGDYRTVILYSLNEL